MYSELPNSVMAEYESLVGPPRYKSHRKYGSVSTYMKREKIIKHAVKSDDTLQGIALKYGTSMEVIKRQNHLWTNDSLLIKNYLEIPVPQDVNFEDLDASAGVDSSSSEAAAAPTDTKENSESSDTSLDIEIDSSEAYVPDRSEISVNDFLSRVDSNITATKSNVEMLERKSSFISDPLNLCTESKLSTCRISDKKRTSDERVEDCLNDIPFTLVKNPSSLKLRNSKERLEKKQDELFEL